MGQLIRRAGLRVIISRIVEIVGGDAPLDAANGHGQRGFARATRPGGNRGGGAGGHAAARGAVRSPLGLVLALQQELTQLREDLGQVIQGLQVPFRQRLGLDVREVHLEDVGRDGTQHDLEV